MELLSFELEMERSIYIQTLMDILDYEMLNDYLLKLSDIWTNFLKYYLTGYPIIQWDEPE